MSDISCIFSLNCTSAGHDPQLCSAGNRLHSQEVRRLFNCILSHFRD